MLVPPSEPALPAPPGAIVQFGDESNGTIGVLAFLDAKTLLAHAPTSGLHLLDLTSGNMLTTFLGNAHRIDSVAPSPDRRILASAGGGEICFWNLSTGELIKAIRGPHKIGTRLAFAPDGKTAAASTDGRTILLYDVAAEKKPLELTGFKGAIDGLVFTPDGKTLVSGSEDNWIRLWDIASGQERSRFQGHHSEVCGITLSPDGKTLASVGDEEVARVWDLETGKPLAMLTGHEAEVYCIAFSPDGKLLATGSQDTTVRLWEAATGRQIALFRGHEGTVFSVAFSPDGKALASGGADGKVILWKVGE